MALAYRELRPGNVGDRASAQRCGRRRRALGAENRIRYPSTTAAIGLEGAGHRGGGAGNDFREDMAARTSHWHPHRTAACAAIAQL
jgi:hypothetical protein